MNEHYGIYRGLVVDANDPENLARLRVQVPQLFGSAATDWAWPVLPVQGTALPKIGGPVWVSFEGGDITKPIWLGIWLASPTTDVPVDDALFWSVVYP